MPLTGNDWDLLINGVGLLGVVLLFVPAWHANKYAMLMARLGTLHPTSLALRQKQQKTMQDLKKLRDSWTPWKGRALIWGTLLAGLSFLLGLAKVVAM